MRESQSYRREIETAAAKHGLDPDLVEAIVIVESSGLTHAYRYEPAFWRRYLADDTAYKEMNPRRASSSYGLMQVMYSTARDLGFTNSPELLFVPSIGLDYGCRFLASLVRRTPDLDHAIAAYNGGLGRVRGQIPPDLSIYVSKVKHALEVVKAPNPAPAG